VTYLLGVGRLKCLCPQLPCFRGLSVVWVKSRRMCHLGFLSVNVSCAPLLPIHPSSLLLLSRRQHDHYSSPLTTNRYRLASQHYYNHTRRLIQNGLVRASARARKARKWRSRHCCSHPRPLTPNPRPGPRRHQAPADKPVERPTRSKLAQCAGSTSESCWEVGGRAGRQNTAELWPYRIYVLQPEPSINMIERSCKGQWPYTRWYRSIALSVTSPSKSTNKVEHGKQFQGDMWLASALNLLHAH
jgi:hypothetical protein